MSDRTSTTTPQPAFDLKGAVLSATVLRLRTDDVERVERELRQRTAQLPHFFASAPVILDCEALSGPPPFAALAQALRRCGMVPVGVRNVGTGIEAAAAAGFGRLEEGAARAPQRGARPAPLPEPGAPVEAPAAAEQAAPPTVQPPTSQPTMVIERPVRSGQVVHATGADLLLLAPVNAGAEVIADGHVHAYGPLRGRVLAGAAGNLRARIFATQMSAELVSVAGHYLRADQLPPGLRGKPAQVLLNEQGGLEIRAL